jgi:hypothetical protein
VDEEGVADFDLAEDVGGEEGDGCRGAAISMPVGASAAAAFVEVAADVFVADQASEVVDRREVARCAWVQQLRPVVRQKVVGVAAIRPVDLAFRFGKSFANDWGWAQPLFPTKKRIVFSDLETHSGLGHLRPHFQLASSYTHAGAHGTSLGRARCRQWRHFARWPPRRRAFRGVSWRRTIVHAVNSDAPLQSAHGARLECGRRADSSNLAEPDARVRHSMRDRRATFDPASRRPSMTELDPQPLSESPLVGSAKFVWDGKGRSAKQWETAIAPSFLGWRQDSGCSMRALQTFADAVHSVVSAFEKGSPTKCWPILPDVFGGCDDLKFDHEHEAIAYAALHLVERYARVTQVLAFALQTGAIRLRGVKALEVGAGPAPALYASRDFLDQLASWPNLGSVEVGQLSQFHPLDRGRAWHRFIHHLSEVVLQYPTECPNGSGALGFGLAEEQFSDFDVRQTHHRRILQNAEQIRGEFDRADEYITDSAARRMSYEQGGDRPSAYDLIFVSNFLTNAALAETFAVEIDGLCRSLTPGGLLVVLGSTASGYHQIYDRVRSIAREARLVDASPKTPMTVTDDPASRLIVEAHLRTNFNSFRSTVSPARVKEIERRLPRDLVDHARPIEFPSFMSLVFVNRTRQRRT